MNRRRQKCRERARARQSEARAALSQFGLSPNDPIFKLAVLTDDLSPSQTSFFAVNSINRLVEEVPGVDVIVYVQHAATSCLATAFPVLDTQRFLSCGEPVVVTSVDLCLAALLTNAPTIFHYVTNLDFINGFSRDLDIFRRAYADPRVRVLARGEGEDHKKVLETEFEIQVFGVFPDLDLVAMLPTIVKEAKSVGDRTRSSGADAIGA